MDAVKACSLDPSTFARRFADAATGCGFRAEPFAEAGGVPLVAYTRRTPGPRPRIYVSSGIHGDEPAPPLALLALLEAGVFDDRATWFLCPLLNPTGLARGTRENDAAVDLNRDYLNPQTVEIAGHVRWLRRQPGFDLALCLHEDWETQGFYLYELNRPGRPSLADTMILTAANHMPIESTDVIDGRPATAPGLVRPAEDPLLREKWAEAIYLHAHHSRMGYTLETPSALPLDLRVATMTSVVRAGIEKFLARLC
jgi:predicted deacylase